jgi:hypothetical protein
VRLLLVAGGYVRQPDLWPELDHARMQDFTKARLMVAESRLFRRSEPPLASTQRPIRIPTRSTTQRARFEYDELPGRPSDAGYSLPVAELTAAEWACPEPELRSPPS